jgi:hypothetical protein
MYTEVDEYIRANRDRYTREAITQQLIAAGHDRATVDAAWERADADASADPAPAGWRPGWWILLGLLVLGAIGAALVWADERYGAGIAPVAYFILAFVAVAAGKGIATLIDGGHRIAVGILLGLLALGGAYLSISANLLPVAVLLVLGAGIPALLLLARGDHRTTGWIAAAVPMLVWLAVTGTCYAPLFGKVLAP